MRVLGVSANFHDSAAALVADGVVVAAAEEERFSRVKHDSSVPAAAMAYCLEAGGVGRDELDAVVYYEKPLVSFLRILRTRFAVAPRGHKAFSEAVSVWVRHKLWIDYEIQRELRQIGVRPPKKLWYSEHHLSHAASAFFASPFERAAVLTFDGVGEFATTSIAMGVENRLTMRKELDFPNSIGLLYSAFTGYCGFRVNSGEYKLMGLAPYGLPVYVDRILDRLVQVRADGSFTLDMSYFAFLAGERMTNQRFDDLFGGPARDPEAPVEQRHADLARSIQHVTEEIVLGMARHAQELTGARDACLAGGVALNCVANRRLLDDGPFDRLWIQPAAGDAGGALGAALYGYHVVAGHERVADGTTDLMQGAFLGPSIDDDAVRRWLDAEAIPHVAVDRAERPTAIARLLAGGNIVAVVDGRMEFGPRALGNRSILADPRSIETSVKLNEQVKKRESFRPFAPAVLAEKADEWFDLPCPSPYMLLIAPVTASRRTEVHDEGEDVMSRARTARSEIAAVTHVDYSARVQTVDADRNPGFHAILSAFDALTGCPVLVNTSFNVRGEPIVCTPEDAYRCFMSTELDHLVLGSFVLTRADQPADRILAAPLAHALD